METIQTETNMVILSRALVKFHMVPFRMNCSAAWHRTGVMCPLVNGLLSAAWMQSGAPMVTLIYTYVYIINRYIYIYISMIMIIV